MSCTLQKSFCLAGGQTAFGMHIVAQEISAWTKASQSVMCFPCVCQTFAPSHVILALVCCAFLCSEGARHNLQSFEVLPPFAKMVNGITTDFMHQEVEKHCSPMCGPEALKPFQNLAKVRDTVRNLQLQALLEPCAPQLGQLADSLSAHLGQMAHLHRAAVRNSIEALRVHYMTFQKWKHKDWFVWW